MNDFELPIVGGWYLHSRFDEPVEVVYVDEISGIMDVHDASGRIHELQLTDWFAADRQLVPAPKNLVQEASGSDDDSIYALLLTIAV